MAKRRNAKKEKALRNKQNARQFRKVSSRRHGKYQRYQNNSEKNQSDSDNDSSEERNSSTKTSEKTQAKAHTDTNQSSSVPKPHVSDNKVTTAKSE